LIAADGYRVGAVEQLRAYARIIGSPFTVARTMGDLDRALGRRTGDGVLIDTAGRGARQLESREWLEWLGTHTFARTHVVLSATTAVRDAARLLDCYAPARPARVVLTRVDESDAIGPLVGLLRERQLPLSYLGLGQRVPEDLARATAPVLAAHLLGDRPEYAGDPA
jgi:flagellar biosynthesis protein FlhF